MIICNQNFIIEDTFDKVVTIPDCFIFASNKLGVGHGEAKLYFASKDEMRGFFGQEGFSVNCFLLKSDLISYLNSIKQEYFEPSQDYVGKEELPRLWHERMEKVLKLDDIISFSIDDQKQILGPRGYINSSDKNYNLLRELPLPLCTYISVMRLKDEKGKLFFYWKLFIDYQIIAEKKNGPLVFNYGKKNLQKDEKKIIEHSENISRARIGQGKYREKLLLECPFCPITMLNEEELLIASHIKPWAVSTDKEKIDPKNGFILSPLYDKLFDRGYITFTEDKNMLVTAWLSERNKKRLNLKENAHYPHLPMDESRKFYLEYHRENVFKG